MFRKTFCMTTTTFHHSGYFKSSIAIILSQVLSLFTLITTDSDLQVCITDYLLPQCFLHLQQPNGIFMMTRTAQLGGVETSK